MLYEVITRNRLQPITNTSPASLAIRANCTPSVRGVSIRFSLKLLSLVHPTYRKAQKYHIRYPRAEPDHPPHSIDINYRCGYISYNFV